MKDTNRAWMNSGATKSVAALVVLLAGLMLGSSLAANNSYTAHVAVHFSPHGGCTDAVVRELTAAQKQVLVQAYSFTSAPIAKALMDAHKRGVKVLAVLDKSNQTDRYSAATFLANVGIPTLIDSQHAIAHAKVMVIDDTTVITGSFNFTKAAEERNAENLLVIKDAPELAKAYEANIHEHAAHSHPYQRAEAGSAQGTGLEQGEIRGNRKSKIYRVPGCPGYGRLSPANGVTFKSEAEALATGYRKAKNCP